MKSSRTIFVGITMSCDSTSDSSNLWGIIFKFIQFNLFIQNCTANLIEIYKICNKQLS